MRKGWLTLCLGIVLAPAVALAQLAVADAPVLGAVATAVTALKSILDDTRQTLEDLANWSQVVQRLQAIAQLTTDLEALMAEIASVNQGWEQLADSGRGLCSIDEAVSWKGQALQWQHTSFKVAHTAQRLLGRSLAVMIDIQRVVTSIVGPTSGTQSSSALLSIITSELAHLQGLTGSFQTAALGRDVIQSVIGIQLVCMQQGNYAGWGSYSR